MSKHLLLYKKGDWKKLIWLSFALFIALRIIFLDADPPEHLNWAWGEWVDAGSYSYNARNKVLFGKWELDDWNLMWVAPIGHWVSYLLFKLLGVGFWQNNLVPAFFSSLTVILFYFLLKTASSSFYAYIGTFLLGMNYLLITYARVGNRVTEMIFFMLLSAYFWQKGFKNILYFYLAGIAVGLSFLSKPSMVNFIPAIILSTIVCSFWKKEWHNWRDKIQPILILMAGIITVGIFWYLVLFIPHKHIYDIFIGRDIKVRTPFSFIKLIRNIWKTPIAYYFSLYLPVMFYISLISILKIIYNIFQKYRFSPMEVFSTLWFASDFFFNTLINYRPLRFFVSSIPPLIILFVAIFKEFWELREFKVEKIRPPFLLASFIWFFFTIQYLLNENIYFLSDKIPSKLFLFYRLPFPQNYYQAYKTVFLMTFIAIGIFYIVIQLIKNKVLRINPYVSRSIILIAFAISLAHQVNFYVDWATNYRSYKIINYSRFLMEIIPKGPISGNIAPMLCFENEFKAYLIYRDRNNWYNKPFQRYRITHMQMANPHDERDGYFSGFKEIMKDSMVIATFPLRGRMEELWKRGEKEESPIEWKKFSSNKMLIKNIDKIFPHTVSIKFSNNDPTRIIQLKPLEEKVIISSKGISINRIDYNREIELCKREVGMPVYDPKAHNLIAVKADKRAMSLICIDKFNLDEGLYKFSMRVMINRKVSKPLQVRIYDKEGNPLDIFELNLNKLPLNAYDFISESFKIYRREEIILEIFNPENENIYLDAFQIIPQKE